MRTDNISVFWSFIRIKGRSAIRTLGCFPIKVSLSQFFFVRLWFQCDFCLIIPYLSFVWSLRESCAALL